MRKIFRIMANYRDGSVSLIVSEQEERDKKLELQYKRANFWTQT